MVRLLIFILILVVITNVNLVFAQLGPVDSGGSTGPMDSPSTTGQDLGGATGPAESATPLPGALQPGADQGLINPVPGHGGDQNSAGIALMGPTKEAATLSAKQGGENGWKWSGYFDAKTDKDIMIPCKSDCRGSKTVLAPGPGPTDQVVGPTPPPGGGTASEKDFNDSMGAAYGFSYPVSPNGLLNFDKSPVFQWTPTVPKDVLYGGANRLCIYSVCNPDLGFFSDRGKGSKYVLEGTGVGGWAPFTTGDTGSRFCMSGKGCVTSWKLPESKLNINGIDVSLQDMADAAKKATSLPVGGISLENAGITFELKDLLITGGSGL